MNNLLLVFFGFLFIIAAFILYFSRKPEDLHKVLIWFKSFRKKIRYKGSVLDLISICSSQVYQASFKFVDDFSSLEYFTSQAINSTFQRYAFVCSVYEQCSFLCFAVNENFAHKVMKSSFDRYHETVLFKSCFLNGEEIQFDDGIVHEIEQDVCSSEDVKPVIYYYKMVMLIMIRSKVLSNADSISTDEVRPIAKFMQSWSKLAIDDLAKVYDSVRPFIK